MASAVVKFYLPAGSSVNAYPANDCPVGFQQGRVVTMTCNAPIFRRRDPAPVDRRGSIAGNVTFVASAGVTAAGDGNTANDAATNSIAVPGGPASLKRVWVANAGSNFVSMVNPADNTATTLNVGDTTNDVAFSPDGRRAFVASAANNAVTVLDTRTLATLATLTVPAPQQVQITSGGRTGRARAGGHRVERRVRVRWVELHAGEHLHGGSRPAWHGRVAGRHPRVGRKPHVDSVSQFDPSSPAAATTIPLGPGDFPVDIAAAPNGRRIYVANYFGNSVSVIDTQSQSVVSTIFVGLGPQGIAITPDGSRLYVSNFDDGTVSVVDVATEATIATPFVNGSPNGVTVSPDGTAVYVTAYNGAELAVIATATNTISGTVATGNFPSAVEYVRSPLQFDIVQVNADSSIVVQQDSDPLVVSGIAQRLVTRRQVTLTDVTVNYSSDLPKNGNVYVDIMSDDGTGKPGAILDRARRRRQSTSARRCRSRCRRSWCRRDRSSWSSARRMFWRTVSARCA